MSLATRSTADERMDTDCVDYDDYRHCLRDLARVNTVTLTPRPTLAWLAREMAGRKSFSLLDVACGHGDILRRIHRWAERKGIATRLEGVDLNPWSARAARFDYIISSQVTHHLTDDTVVKFIRWMEAHARRGWFIGDLHRHWFPYYGFGVLAWLARWHPFVLSDGRISIARSFVRDDWLRLIQSAGLTEADVEITWHLPFRLCVARRCPDR